MAEQIIPASPSWYCSRVMDCNKNGLLCFGAKHSLVMYDISVDPPAYTGHILAHQERIVGLSMSPVEAGEQGRMASVGEDGKVKVWDLKTKQLSLELANPMPTKFTTVHWWPSNKKEEVVSGDDKGTLVVWNLAKNENKTFHFESQQIFSITCSPHHNNLIAIGYRSGLVLVVNVAVRGGLIVQHLKGHDDEVHAICWSPQLGQGEDFSWKKSNKEEELHESDEECLLATGSKDRSIKIWSLLSGRPLQTLRLPSNTGVGRRERQDDMGSRGRVWLTVHWPAHRPREIFSSSFNGDVLQWDLSKSGKKTWQLLTGGAGKGHQRIVFNIAGYKNTLTTISMDRQIVFWDDETLSTTGIITSLGGFVYSLVSSPINPGRIALGVGDNLVRVWNTDNPNDLYDLQTYWQGIKSKVTTLCWHPTKEGLIAYGTDDGRVGILDVLSSRFQLSSTYHKRTVYVVTWGPYCSRGEDDDENRAGKFAVYSCGDCVILQHDPAKLDHHAKDISKVIRKTNGDQTKCPGRSEVSWKPDFSVVAMGNDDGSVEIFRAGNLELLVRIELHRKLVNCVRWHPEYTGASTDRSACHYWLASGSNECGIHVVDLKKVLDDSENRGKVAMVTESFCQLEGHSSRITGLSWSSHGDGRLVSVSYDWTAQVWDVKAGCGLANYRGHSGRLLAVQWSATNPDLIMSGGDDFSVHVWDITKQEHTLPPSIGEKRKMKSKIQGKQKNQAPRNEGEGADEAGLTITEGNDDAAAAADMKEIQDLLNKKKAELLAKVNAEAAASVSEAAVSPPRPTMPPDASRSLEMSSLLEMPAIPALVMAHLGPKASPPRGMGSVTAPPSQREGTVTTPPRREGTGSAPSPHREATAAGGDAPFTKRDFPKKDAKDRQKRRARSLFPISSQMDNRGKSFAQEDCITLADYLFKKDNEVMELPEEETHLGCFLNRRTTYQMLQQECTQHTETGSSDQMAMLSMMKGNIAPLIKTATAEGRLNEFLVSLAATASHQIWQETCVAFASQLEGEGSFQKGVSYMLAAGQVPEAIQYCQRHGLHKDAACIAQSRLSPFDPQLKQVYTAWAHQLCLDGNFELAAKCCMAGGDAVEGARLLARRSDSPALRVAALTCVAAGEVEAAATHTLKLVQQCMLSADWALAADVILTHKKFQVYGLLLTTHRVLVRELLRLNKLPPDIIPATGLPEEAPPGVPSVLPMLLLPLSDAGSLAWAPHTVLDEAFIVHMVRVWYDELHLNLNPLQLEDTDIQLAELRQTQQPHTATKQVLVDLSLHIASGIVKMLLGDVEEAAHYWTVAMSMCCHGDMTDISQGLCRLLLPTGADSLHQIQKHLSVLSLSATGNVTAFRSSVAAPNDQTPVTSISNDSQTCRGTDALRAFYYLHVLQESKGRVSGRDLNVTENGESGKLCATDASLWSRSLLWDIFAEKCRLEEMLESVKKAINKLLSQPNAVRSPQPLTESSDGIVLSIGSSENNQEEEPKTRRYSGAYVDMASKLLKRGLIPGFRPHEQMLRSGSEDDLQSMNPQTADKPPESPEEEFVDMNPIGVPHVNSTIVNEVFDPSGGCSPVMDVRSNPLASSDSASRLLSPSKSHASFLQTIPETGARAADSAPDLRELPQVIEEEIFAGLDVVELCLHQEAVEEKLETVSRKVDDHPFPNPVDSAVLISDVCSPASDAELAVVLQGVREWANKWAYLPEQLSRFCQETPE